VNSDLTEGITLGGEKEGSGMGARVGTSYSFVVSVAGISISG